MVPEAGRINLAADIMETHGNDERAEIGRKKDADDGNASGKVGEKSKKVTQSTMCKREFGSELEKLAEHYRTMLIRPSEYTFNSQIFTVRLTVLFSVSQAETRERRSQVALRGVRRTCEKASK